MEALLVRSLVLMVVLTSSYASEKIPDPCEDEKVKVLKELVEVQREKGDTLKEIVETQRQKDEKDVSLIQFVGRVEKLQTLEESQNELSLALNKLLVRLDFIEAKMNAEAEQMNDRLDVINKNYEEVLQRLQELEQVKSHIPEVTSDGCQTPFEKVGEDCVHWIDKAMTWADSRNYCVTLGGDLIVPTIKEGFELEYGHRSMSDLQHPPLFSFLYERAEGGLYGWIGASVDTNNNAKWISGDELKRAKNRLQGSDHGQCIAAYVTSSKTYATWTAGCETSFSTPICQKKIAK